ncbi:MAG: NAD(P)H-hydrate epimerase [Gemmataceae bacterium]
MGTGAYPILSRAAVRALDERAVVELGIPSLLLMENAGRGTAEALARRWTAGPVAICCGKGNNGGDGLTIARHVELLGLPVRTVLLCRPEELTGDSSVQYTILARAGIPVQVISPWDAEAFRQHLSGASWIVDALLGTGLSGPARPPYDAAISAINQARAAGARVLAVDVPSGLDCDTGHPLGTAVCADVTVTLAGIKKGFLAAHAALWTGELIVEPIGLPRRFVERFTEPAGFGAGPE